jgi:hypothetical protein
MWRLPQHLLLSQALDVGHSPGAATACRPLWPTVKTDSKNHCPGAATACRPLWPTTKTTVRALPLPVSHCGRQHKLLSGRCHCLSATCVRPYLVSW